MTKKAYFISGLGAKCSIFDWINLSKNYQKVYLEWINPLRKESLISYCKRISEPINENEKFILIGLSFGGIIVQEIAKFKKPEYIILISSIRNEKEFSIFFRIVKGFQLQKLLPKITFSSKGFLLYVFLRKIYSKKLPNVQNFLRNDLDNYFYTWSINHIINWKSDFQEISYRIQGTKDPVFPIKLKHQNDFFIENGSHIMILSHSQQIESIINEIISHE